MIYYNKDEILIRNMEQDDIQIITDEEIAQGWPAAAEKYEMRFRHQAEGKLIALVAEYQGNVAGYANVYFNSEQGAFANKGYPEIVDFGVLEKFRRQGIGNKLMEIAEKIASEYSNVVCLGVDFSFFLYDGLWNTPMQYVLEWDYTADMAVPRECMSKEDTFRTEQEFGTGKQSANPIPPAATMTILFYICPKQWDNLLHILILSIAFRNSAGLIWISFLNF